MIENKLTIDETLLPIFDLNSIAFGIAMFKIMNLHRESSMDYELVQANPAFYNLININNFTNTKCLLSQIVLDDFELLRNKFNEVICTGTESVYEIYEKSTKKQLQLNITKTNDELLTITCLDITQQKSAQTRLQEYEEKYITLIESLPDIVYVIDKDLRVRYVNSVASDFLHRSPDDLVGKTQEEIFPPQYAEPHKKDLSEVLLTGRTIIKVDEDYNGWLETRLIPLIDNGVINGVMGISRNITSQKRTEIELNKAIADWKNTFNTINDAIAIISTEGVIQNCNTAMGLMFNSTVDLLTGEKCFDIIHGDKVRHDECPINRINTTWKRETIEIFSKGKWLNVSIDPIFDDNGKLSGGIHVIKDITQRKYNESYLLESELRYRSILNASPMGLHLYKLVGNDRLIFIGYNPAADKILGADHKELIGSTIEEAFPPLATTEIPDIYKRIARSGANWQTEQVNYDDGKIHGAFIVFAFQTTPANMAVFFLDITDRIRSEKALRESEEKYRSTIISIDDIVFGLDKNGCFTEYYNPIQNNINFTSPEQIAGKHFINSGLPEYVTNLLSNAFNAVMKYKKVESFDYNLTINGKIRWFDAKLSPRADAHGNIIGVTGVIRDMTDRIIVEMALKDSEEQFRTLFALIPDSIFIVEHQTGRIIDVNDKAIEIYGYSRQEFQILNIAQLSAVHEITGQAIQSFIHVVPIRYHRKKTGEIFPVEIVSSYLDLKGRKLIIGAIRDITARVKIEKTLVETDNRLKIQNQEYLSLNEELTETNERIVKMNMELIAAKEKAEESDRLKSAFLANMSHEIRTPMNGIVGFAAMLDNPDLTEDKRKEFVEIINLCSNQLLVIIEDILVISRIETGQVSIINQRFIISDLLHEVETLFIPTIKAKEDVSLKLNETLTNDQSYIRTDFLKLKQILANIIGNAIKFTQKGYVEFGYTQSADFFTFYVKDTGIGIPAELHTVIFDRFRQAEISDSRNYGGTGLGLSISKAYIEMLGGKIWVDSTPGTGSTFYFTIKSID